MSKVLVVARIVLVAGVGMLCGAQAAQAATTTLYASQNSGGAADCSSPADACSIEDAITDANAAPLTDDVRILLNRGLYPLSTANPTALEITFAGLGVSLEGRNGTPILRGGATFRILSVDAASTVSIDGIDFIDGSSTGMGGAILNGGTLSVTGSSLTGNQAANGGAISNMGGATLKVEYSNLSQNVTNSVGGGALLNAGDATIEQSLIANNVAPINGGGINVQPGGTLTILDSTVFDNWSGDLGGAFSSLGTLNIFSSTVMGNQASSGNVVASGTPDVSAAGSLLISGGNGNACSPVNSALTDLGYNLEDGNTCGLSATGSHPGDETYGSSTYGAVLDSYLADDPTRNGGPTNTVALLNTPDPATGLANPALGVVPPNFALPAPIGSPLCAQADQRGFLPAPALNCDIGAYLLQPTEVGLTSSSGSVEQNEPVTYRAIVSPVPDGGTVTFDDGSGNPASNQCGTVHLANGVATCTVSYPNTGTYPVTASYSGDGAKNNFAGSDSADPTNVTTTVTQTPPPVVIVDRPLRIIRSIQNRKAGFNTIRVGIPAAGTISLIGYKKLKSRSAHFEAAGVYSVKAAPKGVLLRNLNSRGRGRALVKIRYVPDQGRAIVKSVVYPFVKTLEK